MKKIIPLLFVMLLFSSCTATNKPIEIKDFSKEATISMGSFSYSANVKWKDGAVYIIATSTNAKGLTLSCNGIDVAFSKGVYSKSVPIEKVTSYNPAVILYSIFSNTQQPQYNKLEETYLFKGNTSIGEYEMICDSDGNVKSISISNEKYEIIFS